MRLAAARPPAMTMALARARGAASAARPQARPAPRRRPGTAGSQAIASTGRIAETQQGRRPGAAGRQARFPHLAGSPRPDSDRDGARCPPDAG